MVREIPVDTYEEMERIIKTADPDDNGFTLVLGPGMIGFECAGEKNDSDNRINATK